MPPILKPNRATAIDIPAQVFTGTDNALEVGAILSSHDMGYFQRSAVFVDAMMMDDRILSLYQRRTAALGNLPLTIKPANKSLKARKLAELLGGSEDESGKWKEYCPPEVLEEILGWGLMIGVVAVQKIWDQSELPWAPRLRAWHPQFLTWNAQARTYYLSTQNQGQIRMPRPDEDHPEWFIHAPYGFVHGWRRAIVRAIAFRYLQRRWNDRDWSRYCEVHGLAIRKAKYPNAEGDTPKVRNFCDDVAMLGTDTMIELPQGDPDKASFDVDFLEAKAQTYECFKDQRDEINRDLGILMMGENLSTDAGSSGSPGSFALSKTQAPVSQDRTAKDAGVAVVLRKNVLRPWAEYYKPGGAAIAPMLEWQTEPPEDDQTRVAVLKGLGDAVTSMKGGFGDRLDEDDLLQRFNVKTRLTKDEWDAIKPEEPPPGMGPPGQGGAPGGNPPFGGGKKAPPEKAKAPEEPPKRKVTASEFHTVERREFAGLSVGVENPAGSFRNWYDPEANRGGKTLMHFDYGFIDGHTSGDGEELDCYLGPDEGAPDVHIVHQLKAPDFATWDEDKVMLGFPDAAAAKEAFLLHRDDGDRCFGGMSTLPADAFRAKLRRRRSEKKITASAAPATLYPDQLAENGTRLASDALRAQRRMILSAIEKGESWNDIKERVADAFKDFDAEALAGVLEKTFLMAHLGGRLTAVDAL